MLTALKKARAWLDWRSATAVVSGLLLALAYPGWGVASLAWLAPGLLLLSASGASPRRTVGLGYLMGLVHYLISLSWLTHNPFPAGAIAGWIALSTYVAVYPALWVWLCWRMAPKRLPGDGEVRVERVPRCAPLKGARETLAGAQGTARPTTLIGRFMGSPDAILRAYWDHEPRRDEPLRESGSEESVRGLVELGPPENRFMESLVQDLRAAWDPIVNAAWLARLRWILCSAALWVALEMVRARLFTGFPWNLLGVSQYDVLPLIQIARVTGVYGVSFLVVWGSVALAGLAMGMMLERPRIAGDEGRVTAASTWRLPPLLPATITGRRLLSDLGLPLLLVGLATLDFGLRTTRPLPAHDELRLALIQPSIPQELIFDPAEASNRFDRIMALSQLALETEPDVLVWPENSLPSFDASHLRALTNLIADHGVWMIFGADDAERVSDPGASGELNYYNSAFLFDPEGRYRATYRKRQLVIFGEYIPLERWLPITKVLTPIQGSFSAGPGPVAFKIDSPRATTSALICFEDIFPRLVRSHAGPEIDFLLNLTNDAWFGESHQHWQHAANAVFRAVENGLPLVRCANNGLTCWIDHLGRVREFGVGAANDVHGAGFRVVRIPLRASVRPRTFYQQYGDAFGWACCGLSGLFILGNRYRRS